MPNPYAELDAAEAQPAPDNNDYSALDAAEAEGKPGLATGLAQGFARGLGRAAEGLQNAVTAHPEPILRAPLTAPGSSVGEIAGGLVPYAFGAPGMITAGVSALGNTRTDALARGDSQLSAGLQGVTVGALTTAVPGIAGKMAGRIAGGAIGAAGRSLIPQAVSKPIADVIAGTAEHGLAGAFMGTTLATGEATVLLTAGHPEAAGERLKQLPEDLLVTGAMGGLMHAVPAAAGLPGVVAGRQTRMAEISGERANTQRRFAQDRANVVAERQLAEAGAADDAQAQTLRQENLSGAANEAEGRIADRTAFDAEQSRAADENMAADFMAQDARVNQQAQRERIVGKMGEAYDRPHTTMLRPASEDVAAIEARRTLREQADAEARIQENARNAEAARQENARNLDAANAEENHRNAAAVEDQGVADLERSIRTGMAEDTLSAAENAPGHDIVVPERPPQPITEAAKAIGIRPATGKTQGGEHDHFPLSSRGRARVSGGWKYSTPGVEAQKIVEGVPVELKRAKQRRVAPKGESPDRAAQQLEAMGLLPKNATAGDMWDALAAEEATMNRYRADVKATAGKAKQYREGNRAARKLVKEDAPEVLKPVPKEPTAVPADVGMEPPRKGRVRPPNAPEPAPITPDPEGVRKGPTVAEHIAHLADMEPDQRAEGLKAIKDLGRQAAVREELVRLAKARTLDRRANQGQRIKSDAYDMPKGKGVESTPMRRPPPERLPEEPAPASAAAASAPGEASTAKDGEVVTAAGFRQQVAAANSRTKMGPEEAAAATESVYALMEAAAAARGTHGEHVDTFVRRLIKGVITKGGKRNQLGGAIFEGDGPALLRILRKADPSTGIHELAHIFRKQLRADDLAAAEKALGVKDGKWTDAHEETFARQFEKWVSTGLAPTPRLVPVFEKFATWMKSIYASVNKSNVLAEKLSPAMARVFENIFTSGRGLGGPEPVRGAEPVKAAEPAAPKAAEPAKDADTAPPAEPPAGEAKPSVPRDPGRNVGIKNEESEADRRRMGMPERDTPEGRKFDEMYDEGKAAIAADPSSPYRILDSLRKDPERILRDSEVGAMVAHKVTMEHDLVRLVKDAHAARERGDANGSLIAERELATQRDAMREFTELMEQTGTATGRALVARRMMSDMDYSLSGMEARAEAAKGSKLDDGEHHQLEELYQLYQDKSAMARKRIQKRIDILNSRMDTKDFTRKQRQKEVYDEETMRLQTELEGVKRRWTKELRDWELANRSRPRKALDAVLAIPGFTKSLKATLDMSALLRQGWRVALTNPTIWGKNAARSFKDVWDTFGGKEVMDAVHAEMLSSPYYEQMKTAKLAVKHAEEEFPSTFLTKIPGAGRVFKAAEDSFTAFQYRNRIHVFEKMLDVAKASGVDITNTAQLRSIGKMVNSLTGRGHLGNRLEPVADVMNNVFFSARKLKGDLDFLTGHNLSLETTAFVRKQAAINLAKVIAGTATVLAIANLVDDKSVNFDPRSSDYGKIKAGNTRFDVTGGAAPILTLAARLVSGSAVSAQGKTLALDGEGWGTSTRLDAVGRFLRNKLSPVSGVGVGMIDGMEKFDGSPVTWKTVARDLLVPMSIDNFATLMNDTKATPAIVTAGVVGDFFGIGAHTYDADAKRTKAKSGPGTRPGSR